MNIKWTIHEISTYPGQHMMILAPVDAHKYTAEIIMDAYADALKVLNSRDDDTYWGNGTQIAAQTSVIVSEDEWDDAAEGVFVPRLKTDQFIVGTSKFGKKTLFIQTSDGYVQLEVRK